ncbi:MoaD/ThiS family protein [Amycolatopsis cihanbeyliensis]|uniref:Molybdopterin synthase subunit MoaD n=1 Tax=Amycolatopsis cihanbeyliensis TaxID=1128664 RepID=A0A542DNA4_AMYCI|nr:MoaD/ThiS family protein [Amycolatopsis cihanbeyliensis]TQJ04582.1 molybdopterin synthase subunit MoaD [Amycolatopsis cihanbeyliensis]
MAVTVRLPSVLRTAADGHAELKVPAATLGQLLDELGRRHPALERRLRDERGALRRYVNFYVDGEECRGLAGAETPLTDGAEVDVIPSIAGG